MGDTPRTDAMLGSICGGWLADGVDAVSHEEDYYNKSLKLCRDLERELASLRAEKQRAEAERDDAIADATAVRELMNCYNLGGWTDSVSVMQRALKAEAERDAAVKDAEAKLKAQAAEAYADVDEWAAYASEYFRAKWDLPGTLQKWRDRFEPDAARKGKQ